MKYLTRACRLAKKIKKATSVLARGNDNSPTHPIRRYNFHADSLDRSRERRKIKYQILSDSEKR
jgi:hypothetical protein